VEYILIFSVRTACCIFLHSGFRFQIKHDIHAVLTLYTFVIQNSVPVHHVQ
jgi:hypothetical protein